MSATGYETPVASAAAAGAAAMPSKLPAWRRAVIFGTGFGIALGDRNLDAAVVRARPGGATLVASTTVADFRNRPAAEWGADLLKFLAAAGENKLAATVLLPRDEVIVRAVALPGVADKDAAAAIDLQIDSLHPWGSAEVVWGWSRAAADYFIIGLARKEVLDACETRFAEAGIPIAAVSFSTAVIHAALRFWNSGPASVLCFRLEGDLSGRTEIYGESPARAVFSAEFPTAPERALALARAELRLSQDYPAAPLSEVLPRSLDGRTPPSEVAYAAAIAGSATRAARFANLLPPERRSSHNRLEYAIPGILIVLLALSLLTVFVILPKIDQRRYRADLDRTARQLEPAVLRAQSLEKRLIVSGSTLYGPTDQGGGNGSGTVFAINTNGTGHTNLLNLSASSGYEPLTALALSGNLLYGSTWYSGIGNEGTLFFVSTDGATNGVLHTFATPYYNADSYAINYDGIFPSARLLNVAGTLYGTTEQAGENGSGTIFSVITNQPDSFSIVHYFAAVDPVTLTNNEGAFSFAGLVLSGTNLYGTAIAGASMATAPSLPPAPMASSLPTYIVSRAAMMAPNRTPE